MAGLDIYKHPVKLRLNFQTLSHSHLEIYNKPWAAGVFVALAKMKCLKFIFWVYKASLIPFSYIFY